MGLWYDHETLRYARIIVNVSWERSVEKEGA